MKLNRLEVLSKDEISKIHDASLDILRNVGLLVRSERALKMLDDAGAMVDFREGRVRIPSELVDEALKSAPPIVTLCDRRGKRCAELGDGNTYVLSGFEANYVLSSESGERRLATRNDVADFARLADALKNIHMVSPQVLPSDVAPKYREVYAAQILLNNTEKHAFFAPQNITITHVLFRMARAIVGDDLEKCPILSLVVSPTSPLTWGADDIDTLIEAAQNGVLCNPFSEPMPGASGPMSLAGTLALQNAETLSAILVSQLARKGAPILYGAAAPMLDMREGGCYLSGPEATLLRIAHVQLAKFYGLPGNSTAPDSDSHCLDEQNGWEKLLTTLVAVNSDADLIYNAGMFGAAMTVSFEQLVVDSEILSLVFQLCRGIDVTPETLAVDMIKKVGPGQDFLREREFTLKYLKEYWMPELSSRSAFNRWVQKGRKPVTRVAKEKAEEILRQHPSRELNEETYTKLNQIVKEFEKGDEN